MRTNLKTFPEKFISLLLLVLISGTVCAFDKSQDLSQQQFLERQKSPNKMLVIDVRSEQEYAGGHVSGAINIPHKELPSRLDELKGKEHMDVVLYCESGRRAGMANNVLKDAGFTRLFHLDGDMALWRKNQLPLEVP